MNPSAKASQEYLKGAVMTAPPEQLQLMLFDGAIRFTLRGKEALQRDDIEGAFNGFERAQRIVLELNNGLRREVNPELVDQMAALYNFIFRRLIDANVHRDVQAAEDALRILRHQRETWAMLIEKLAKSSPSTASKPRSSGATGPDESENPSLSIEG
jgi:flagellar protein FliS